MSAKKKDEDGIGCGCIIAIAIASFIVTYIFKSGGVAHAFHSIGNGIGNFFSALWSMTKGLLMMAAVVVGCILYFKMQGSSSSTSTRSGGGGSHRRSRRCDDEDEDEEEDEEDEPRTTKRKRRRRKNGVAAGNCRIENGLTVRVFDTRGNTIDLLSYERPVESAVATPTSLTVRLEGGLTQNYSISDGRCRMVGGGFC